MEQERDLNLFSLDDLLLYFAKSMTFFWSQNNLNPPIYPLFPLNDEVLKLLYNKTDGNARSIIKLIRIFVDKILDKDMTLKELVKEGQAQAIMVQGGDASRNVTGSQLGKNEKLPTAAPELQKVTVNLMEKVEEMMKKEEYIIETNPASVTGATIKSIKVFSEKFGKQVKMEQDFKFSIGKRSYSLAALITFNNKKYGFDIPALKTFDRSGGVAAFYAAKRLTGAISTNVIDYGVLIVPKGTGGAKYLSLLSTNAAKMSAFELTEDSAKFLIKQAIEQPTREAYELAKKIFGELPPYEAPKPPYEEKTGTETAPAEGENVESEPKTE